MAKHEASREDLIRDAVAMVDRAEYVSAAAETVVVGFRSSGAISFYFGDQPVYQFSTERKLRRKVEITRCWSTQRRIPTMSSGSAPGSAAGGR